MPHLTWTDLAPLLRRPEWNEHIAHSLFWGSNHRAMRSPITDRFHLLARQACRNVYAKAPRGTGIEECDLYHGALVNLWDRSERHRGLKAPANESCNADAWVLTVVKNAARDVVTQSLRGADMSQKEERRRANSVKNASEAHFKERGCWPSVGELAESLAISVEDVHSWRAGGSQTPVSIGVSTGTDDDRPGFDIGTDDDVVTRVDARRAYEALGVRLRGDQRVQPQHRLALVCVSYPDLYTPSLVDEAVDYSEGGDGILRSAADTVKLLALWMGLLPELKGDASSGVLAWILRSNEPLMDPEPSESPEGTLRRTCERWLNEHKEEAKRARDLLRKWRKRCMKHFDLREDDA